MPWRFIDDFPTDADDVGRRHPLGGTSRPENAFVLSYLIRKLGDLELEIEDLESSAGTAEEDAELRRLTAARRAFAAAADEVLLRRSATSRRRQCTGAAPL